MNATTQARPHHSGAHVPSLNQLSVSATLHCLTGCGIGEVLGMVISTMLGWGTIASIGLSVALALRLAMPLRSFRLYAEEWAGRWQPPSHWPPIPSQ